MAKAAPPKRQAKEPKDERSQKQRFIDTAKASEVDESGRAFERAITRITQKNPIKRTD